MSFITTFYRSALQRTSTFALTIIAGAVVFERVFDQGTDYMFERMNQGKLWKHIKDKYATEEEE